MKQIIRLTENDLHRLVKESVKIVLNEGLTPVFKSIAKRHGGVKWVDKRYQFDKLQFPNYGWDYFFEAKGSDIPYRLLQFADKVMQFNDGKSLYTIKPQYHGNEQIKQMLKSSEELADLRTAEGGFKAGTVTDYSQRDDWGDPTKKKLTADGMRQWQHKKGRGKSPLEPSRINKEFRDEHDISQTGDYDNYVINFLCDKYNGLYVDYHIAVPTPESGRWGEEAYKIVEEFKKYGYGLDESFGNSDIEYAYDWADERAKKRFNPDIDYMGFEKGETKSYMEWDDPGPFGYSASNPYGSYESSKMKDTPRIGTNEFMKR
jgi:hypothetical protein